ncbi:Plant self-incompatibility S1 [Dillenia turbinata]|uniref:S-protein homolog n=1 Tax=Dillenia turbinata TaxID=194707 RepID=A0AAN8VYF7_9MAGN
MQSASFKTRKADAVVLIILMITGYYCKTVCSETVHASVMNRLGGGEILTVHCQSKDTDLGERSVGDGDEYGWEFSPNVWGTTLFYCDLTWDGGSYHFDAYSFGRDSVRCETQCLWIVSGEGMYGLNGQTGFWEYLYDWQS